ncbi:MAG: hypothetical protein IJB74_06280 [Clostridia bacterium]|nr:hypothetical protein [Clostridia bacterium]
MAEIAEAGEKDKNLESEDLNFSCQNKEEAKKKLEASMKDIDDLFGSLLCDVPDPSQEDVKKGIAKILEHAETEKEQISEEAQSPQPGTEKAAKGKKVTPKVLLLAALLSILSFSTLFVVGSRHNISIENGFMSFAKDTVQVVFFGEDERYISVDSLLEDLKSHGYDDIVFPQEFVTRSDEYKASVPEYNSEGFGQVAFEICCGETIYKTIICQLDSFQQPYDYINLYDSNIVMVDDISVNIFAFGNNDSVMQYEYSNHRYYVQANIPYDKMEKLIKTIK